MRLSQLNGRQHRSTKAELAAIDAAIYEIAEAEHPVTVRGIFYQMVSRGQVPKTDKADKDTGTPDGYGMVQRRVLAMRRNGDLPYGWLTDGTRLRLKPATWSGVDSMLYTTPLKPIGGPCGTTRTTTWRSGQRRTRSAAWCTRLPQSLTCRC